MSEPKDRSEMGTDELKRRAVDWERELGDIQQSLAVLGETRQRDYIQLSELIAAHAATLEDHVGDFDGFRDMVTERLKRLDETVERLDECIEGNGDQSIKESVDRLVKIVDGDDSLGLDGLRQDMKEVRRLATENATTITQLAKQWSDSVRFGKIAVAAFVAGLGINIIFGLYIVWSLIQHNSGGVMPPGFP